MRKRVYKKNNLWVSRIYWQGIDREIGKFKTEKEALEAYEAKAKELFGPYAFLII